MRELLLVKLKQMNGHKSYLTGESLSLSPLSYSIFHVSDVKVVGRTQYVIAQSEEVLSWRLTSNCGGWNPEEMGSVSSLQTPLAEAVQVKRINYPSRWAWQKTRNEGKVCESTQLLSDPPGQSGEEKQIIGQILSREL